MCSRENFNLLSKISRRYFFQRGLIGDKWARAHVLQDTFGRFVCKIIGHGKTFTVGLGEVDNETPYKVCLRCYRRRTP
ncbi:MAG: hypothetical protein UU61_C0016G0020 [Parcubacteria group bacterium GW2011_GWB1_41_4]|nr:MAG: hypothetical protein UU61_C0016G0020 [Parcubacteria group bacterium GW2011_GWB1_41_4]